MDFTIYWFMFPISMLIAVISAVAGIGGSALAMPIFLLVFPLLGPDYVLASPAAAVGVALLTQTTAVFSGFVGYYRRGLVDFHSARPFIAVGAPLAVAGVLMAQFVDDNAIKAIYGALMIYLAWAMIRHHTPAAQETDLLAGGEKNERELRSITATDGTIYTYPRPRQGKGAIATSAGAFLTGMLSVGIGEVVMPQLAKRNRMPIPVAAATSLYVVIIVSAVAAVTQITGLISAGGMLAVPWNLAIYTLPAVIIGGQIGPHLQGRISPRAMELTIGLLFAVIAAAMFTVVWQGAAAT
ncbi:MAG: sulfite exporter TauE/SafE family protein [Proteobacteria bacterium]|nr:sulfite exporter TauE/SafE family protein [Pseudomonadota bacterium]